MVVTELPVGRTILKYNYLMVKLLEILFLSNILEHYTV